MSKVLKEFSRFAKNYESYNVIQTEIAKELLTKVDIKEKTILDLGCGSGTLAKLLKDSFKHLYALDFSEEMLALHPKAENISCIQKDFNDICSFKEVDLILSSSALQWSYDLAKSFQAIAALKKPFALSLFTSNTFKHLHQCAKLESPIYKQEEVLSIAAQYLNCEYQVLRFELPFANKDEMFRYIKHSGISGGEKRLSFKEAKRLRKEYPLEYLEFESILLYSKI